MKNEQYSREALLEKYLSTGLTPEEIEQMKVATKATGPCETCKWRRSIHGKWRCYGALPGGYGCRHYEEKRDDEDHAD